MGAVDYYASIDSDDFRPPKITDFDFGSLLAVILVDLFFPTGWATDCDDVRCYFDFVAEAGYSGGYCIGYYNDVY